MYFLIQGRFISISQLFLHTVSSLGVYWLIDTRWTHSSFTARLGTMEFWTLEA